MRRHPCPKCGSEHSIPDAQLVDRAEGNLARKLQIGLETKPGAFVFKGLVESETRAQVCAGCGYIELYAVDLAAILSAHRRRHGSG
jgi:predicted nucleic-acid-binding Zn-ribbon protein